MEMMERKRTESCCWRKRKGEEEKSRVEEEAD